MSPPIQVEKKILPYQKFIPDRTMIWWRHNTIHVPQLPYTDIQYTAGWHTSTNRITQLPYTYTHSQRGTPSGPSLVHHTQSYTQSSYAIHHAQNYTHTPLSIHRNTYTFFLHMSVVWMYTALASVMYTAHTIHMNLYFAMGHFRYSIQGHLALFRDTSLARVMFLSVGGTEGH